MAGVTPNTQIDRRGIDEPARRALLEKACRLILTAIGEDTSREGLIETPRRFADLWLEFAFHDAGKVDTTFESTRSGDLVIVTGLQVWSMCEHHLLPFRVDITIAYRMADQVLGLSKFARIAQNAAHRLQLQEKLVDDIANDVIAILGTENVAVLAVGEHLCMSMRGVKTYASTITSAWRGVFDYEPTDRQEVLTMLQMMGR